MDAEINLLTAITLTGWSERTFWRRFADGTLERNEKSRVKLSSLMTHLILPLENDDIQLVMDADKGIPQAQTDLAILFLEHGKPKEAVFWLELAAKNGDASAMHWLGKAYIAGQGVPKDENLGMMWIAKSAASGDVFSKAIMQSMIQGVVPSN